MGKIYFPTHLRLHIGEGGYFLPVDNPPQTGITIVHQGDECGSIGRCQKSNYPKSCEHDSRLHIFSNIVMCGLPLKRGMPLGCPEEVVGKVSPPTCLEMGGGKSPLKESPYPCNKEGEWLCLADEEGSYCALIEDDPWCIGDVLMRSCSKWPIVGHVHSVGRWDQSWEHRGLLA